MSAEVAIKAPGQSPPVGLADYLGIFSRRIWWIVIPFVFVVVIAGALGFLLPQEYEASVRVKVLDQGTMDPFYGRVAFKVPHKPFLTTIRQDILNRTFLEPIIEQCRVTEGYDALDPREYQLLLKKVLVSVRVGLTPQKVGPDIISISYRGRDARTVGQFVNGIYQRYTEQLTERYQDLIKRATDDLETQFQEKQGTYDGADRAWTQFQLTDDYRLIGVDYHTRRADLNDTKRLLRDKERERSAKEHVFEQVRSDLRKTDEFLPSVTSSLSPDFLRQKEVIRKAEEELTTLRKKFTDEWPAVKEAKKLLEAERAKMNEIQEFQPTERKTVANQKYIDLDTRKSELEGEIEGLKAEIADLKQEQTRIELDVERIPDITRKADNLENVRDAGLAALERVARERERAQSTWHRITSGGEGGFFQLLDAPRIAEYDAWEPVFPNVGMFVGIGAFVGLLIGCGLAFLMEFTSQSFVTVSQVRRTLPLPVLGRVAAIETVRERRRRIRRRVIIAVVVLILVAILVYAHVCYFTRSLQHNLHPQLFDLMKRFYGSR